MKTRSAQTPARGEASGARAKASAASPHPSPASRRGRKAFARLLGGASKRSPERRDPEATVPRDGARRLVRERPSKELREPRDGLREREPERREPEPLEPFSPLPSVVASSASQPEIAPAVGTSWDRAQVAAMAERMLTSFRRGEVEGQDEVRMQLRVLDAEVRVRIDDGRVVATLVGDGLEGLARTLERELQARGLDSDITLAAE